MAKTALTTSSAWKVALFGLGALGVVALIAMLVTPPGNVSAASVPPPERPARAVGASFVHLFGRTHDEDNWYKSDFYYPNSDHPAWRADFIHFKEDRIELEVRRKQTAYKKFAGAEYQRRGFYGFGRYEVVMRAAPGSGTISSMFTHTHDQFGDPHDEIDIEFLGKDQTYMYANYFTNGEAMGGEYVPLGFDAGKKAHLYAFEWDTDEIRWYVDDKLVYTATASDHPIPQAPGRIILSAWTGTANQDQWAGEQTFKNGTRARFYCLSHQAAGDTSPQCSDTFGAAKRRR